MSHQHSYVIAGLPPQWNYYSDTCGARHERHDCDVIDTLVSSFQSQRIQGHSPTYNWTFCVHVDMQPLCGCHAHMGPCKIHVWRKKVYHPEQPNAKLETCVTKSLTEFSVKIFLEHRRTLCWLVHSCSTVQQMKTHFFTVVYSWRTYPPPCFCIDIIGLTQSVLHYITLH